MYLGEKTTEAETKNMIQGGESSCMDRQNERWNRCETLCGRGRVDSDIAIVACTIAKGRDKGTNELCDLPCFLDG